MHELSIAASLVELINQQIEQPVGNEQGEGLRESHVLSVQLSIGVLSCINPESLRFCFQKLTERTPLQATRLDIQIVPVRVYCEVCKSLETLEGFQQFCCPRCQRPCSDIRSGQELDLESIELSEAPSPLV